MLHLWAAIATGRGKCRHESRQTVANVATRATDRGKYRQMATFKRATDRGKCRMLFLGKYGVTTDRGKCRQVATFRAV